MHKLICYRIHSIFVELDIYTRPIDYDGYTSFLIGDTAIGIANRSYGTRKMFDAFRVAGEHIASIGDPDYFEKVREAIREYRGNVGCM